METSFIPAAMYTLERDTEEKEESPDTAQITEMDIDTLKLNFAAIMGAVVRSYGDDKE